MTGSRWLVAVLATAAAALAASNVAVLLVGALDPRPVLLVDAAACVLACLVCVAVARATPASAGDRIASGRGSDAQARPGLRLVSLQNVTVGRDGRPGTRPFLRAA